MTVWYGPQPPAIPSSSRLERGPGREVSATGLWVAQRVSDPPGRPIGAEASSGCGARVCRVGRRLGPEDAWRSGPSGAQQSGRGGSHRPVAALGSEPTHGLTREARRAVGRAGECVARRRWRVSDGRPEWAPDDRRATRLLLVAGLGNAFAGVGPDVCWRRVGWRSGSSRGSTASGRDAPDARSRDRPELDRTMPPRDRGRAATLSRRRLLLATFPSWPCSALHCRAHFSPAYP